MSNEDWRQINVKVIETRNGNQRLLFVPYADEDAIGYKVLDQGTGDHVYVTLAPGPSAWTGPNCEKPLGARVRISKDPKDGEGAIYEQSHELLATESAERWCLEVIQEGTRGREFFKSEADARAAAVGHLLTGTVSSYTAKVYQLGVK